MQSMTLAQSDLIESPTPHRWSVDDYFRASDAGIFDEKRVELLEGEIVDMPSQKDPHAWAISQLVRELLRVFPDPYWIKIQATLRLNDFSAPEPDVVVMSGPPSPPAKEAPVPLLVIEVSETTLRYDRGRKASLYAANGITDYWVADVIGKQVEVFRDPIRDASQRYGWGYQHVNVIPLSETITPLSNPKTRVSVAAFLG